MKTVLGVAMAVWFSAGAAGGVMYLAERLKRDLKALLGSAGKD